MATQITQIPTEAPGSPYTGTSTYDELVPSNYWPILPVVVNRTDDLVGVFRLKYILRVYKDSVSASNLLATLKQRTNNASTTSNQVAIFDIKGIVNTQIESTFNDSGAGTLEVHKLGSNVSTKILGGNNKTVETIILKANIEYAATATAAPVEQTGGTDVVQITMYYTNATFGLMTYANTPDTNPLGDYTTSALTKLLLSNAPLIYDYRNANQQPGGGGLLQGYINYISRLSDFHTIGFQNKSGWGSDGNFFGLQYYQADGTLVVTYTFPNDATRGGIAPGSSANDSQYLLYAGCGTGNFQAYTGQAHKNNAALSSFDGQPGGATARDFTYYRVYMCDNQNGTSSIRSKYYYFVRDFETDYNCKEQEIVRLGWINELGAWDYYDFRGGKVDTLTTERSNYSSLLGSSSLDSGTSYKYYTWEGGKKTLTTSATLKSTIQTQYIEQEESEFLETMFNSPSVMMIEKGTFAISQRVVITNKSFEKKTSAKNKLQIQYTFEIEHSNPINTNN
tara:strand:+ start:2861 stop:4384 length:1524 start_codon:yes stop_codon:yes gene_type:complete